MNESNVSRFRAWVAKPANWTRRGKILGIAVGVAVVIAGFTAFAIALSPNTDHGRVIGRAYYEAWDQYMPSQCMVHDSNGECTYTKPAYYQHWPATWDVRVKDENGEEETLQVSESVFQGCTEGTWYPGHGVNCTQEATTP